MLRHILPRVGYAAVGLLYITIGFLAARIALLGSRDRVSGMQGALRALLRQAEGARSGLHGGGDHLCAGGVVAVFQGVSERLPDWLARAGSARTRTAVSRVAR